MTKIVKVNENEKLYDRIINCMSLSSVFLQKQRYHQTGQLSDQWYNENTVGRL